MKMIHPDTIWPTQAVGFIFKYKRGTTSSLVEWNSDIPEPFARRPNCPHPINSSTTIEFSIPKVANFALKAYDVGGRELRMLIDNIQFKPGIVKVTFNGTGLSSGVYVVAIDGQRIGINKMVLLKLVTRPTLEVREKQTHNTT